MYAHTLFHIIIGGVYPYRPWRQMRQGQFGGIFIKDYNINL